MDDKGRSGFTLPELLLTLAIVAILAALAIPAMGQFIDRARLRAATEALVEELRQARNHALSRQKTVYFSVSITASRWCYGWNDVAPCNCLSTRGCADGTRQQASNDYPTIKLDRDRGYRSQLRFSAVRGTATAASFSLRGRRDARRVIVSPLGRVRSCVADAAGRPAC